MNISDLITQRILQIMEEQNGIAEIQRNELANTIGCVPSQINYVLTSRFSPEQGYIIESRRGGGGYIKITRVSLDNPSAIMHTLNHIGSEIDYGTCRAHVLNLHQSGFIDTKSAKLLLAATGENSLRALPAPLRNIVRAQVLRQMLLTLDSGKDD